MQSRRSYITLACLFICLYNCFAQQYPFVHYSQKDGLVHNKTKSIFQDSRGRLFIGTFSGLSIYDGTRFTNYTKDNGLIVEVINQVVEMAPDSIWILPNANQVLCLIGGKLKPLITTDGFIPVINKLIKCSDGFYYAFADEGLFRFENNCFRRILLQEKMGRNINGLLVNGLEYENMLFISTDPSRIEFPGHGYMIVYNLKTGKCLISDQSHIVFNTVISPQNEILVATHKGLKTLDKEALLKSMVKFLPPSQLYRSARDLNVGNLYFDRQENLWINTNKGILQIDNKGRHTLFEVKNGLLNLIYSIAFQDRENNMWFLNYQTGMSKLSTQSLKFYSNADLGFTPNFIYTDLGSDSVLFLDATHKKIVLQNSKVRNEYSYILPELSRPDNIFRFMPAKNKFYLIGSWHVYEISNLNKKSILKPELIYKLPPDADKFGYGFCFTLTDKKDNLILASEKLTVIFKDHTSVSYDLGYTVAHDFVISGDYLWLITRNSRLFIFRLHPEDPKNYFELLKLYTKELPRFNARCIAMDKQNNIWVGTRDLGLYIFSFDKSLNLRSWKQLTTKNGLSDNFVEYLNCDKDNNIWACSSSGLDRIKRKGNSYLVEYFTHADNLFQKAINISSDKNNYQWALTNEGILKIDPSSPIKHEFKASIIFTEIIKGTDTLSPYNNHISLGYKENDLEFRMAAPSFIDEKRVMYSYRLDGSHNRAWSEPSRNSSIRLINLAPGKYTLRSKAIFLNDLYPESETSYYFVIRPPWWQRTWFSLCLMAATILIISLGVRFYVRRKIEKQKHILEKQHAIERERTRIAGDMHDDLGAGLSTIKFLSEKIKQNSDGGSSGKDAEKIVTNSNNLVKKMNEIIWAMNENNDSLEDLLFYTRAYAVEYCSENNLSCTAILPESIPSVFVSGEIRRDIFLLVKESLHNIVKHAEATEVWIQFTMDPNLILTIRDNGSGIKNRDRDLTYQGNGIKNMKKRVESMGGNFHFLHDMGVTVRAELPIRITNQKLHT